MLITGRGQTLIVVDDFSQVAMPTKISRAIGQCVLPRGGLTMLKDLMLSRLSNVNDRHAIKMMREYLVTACRHQGRQCNGLFLTSIRRC